MVEQDNPTIHGRTGEQYEFNQNEQEGILIGGVSSGECPKIDIILTESRVYGVHEDTGNILMQTDIGFKYQWYDQDDNPVDKDDPTKMRGEPTEPKEGAVDDAIYEMRSKVRGFTTGWSVRHENGAEYSTMGQYADDLENVENVIEIVSVNEGKKEIEAFINIPNADWGIPGEIYRWIDDHPTLEIVDFRNLSEENMNIIIDRDTSRKGRYPH